MGLLRRMTAWLVGAAVVAGVVACGGGSSRPSQTHRSRDALSATFGDMHGGAERSSISPAAFASGARALPCQEFIGTHPPGAGMRTVLGVVALPAGPPMRRALQTARVGQRDSATRLFAKWGLVIRPDTRFRLIVPGHLRDRLSLTWGNANEGHRGTTIVVNGCPGPRGAKWLAYAGGYYVRRPMCAPVIIAAHGQRRRALIGVGKACPGQRPPPQPTAS